MKEVIMENSRHTEQRTLKQVKPVSKSKRYIYLTQNPIWNLFLLLSSSAVITTISLLLAIGMFGMELFYGFFKSPFLFLLNALPVLFLQAVLWCLTDRQWLAYGMTGLLILGSSAADFYKLKFRSEPFSASDIPMIRAGLNMAGNYNLSVNLRIILAIFVLVIGTVFLAVFARRRNKMSWRIFWLTILLLSVFPLWTHVYSSGDLYNDPTISSGRFLTKWPAKHYASRGFVYPFLYSIADNGNTDPGSSTLGEFLNLDIPENCKADLVFYQLEAFSDLRTIGLKGISNDVYSIYDEIKKSSQWGTMFVNVFAGGTIDTEFCVLTGETAFRSIKKQTDSFVWWLAKQGYHATVNHPNLSTFYSRKSMDEYLGFDECYFSENLYGDLISDLKPSSWFSDCVLFPQVLSQLTEYREKYEHVLLFNISMQGHSPYNEEDFLYSERYWDKAGYSDLADHIMNNYLGSLADTQKCLWAFLSEINRMERPVAVVIYGDHKPWLGDGDCVATEVGINLDSGTEEGYRNRYSTEYLIWMNDAARAIIHDLQMGKAEDIQACELFPKILHILSA